MTSVANLRTSASPPGIAIVVSADAAGIFGEAEGFERYRRETIFERASLSTPIDACPLIHKIYPRGATASHAIDEIRADQDGRADSHTSGMMET